MDSVFGLAGKDWVIVAADRASAFSIIRLCDTEDKIMQLDDNKLFGLAGETGDRINFGEYIQKNIHLAQFRTGIKMTTKETANYARSELAEALRKGPYQVNCLIGGYEPDEGASLYWLDYLGTLSKITRGGHGYGSSFLAGLMDNLYKPDMTLDEGIQVAKYCINELQIRFLISQAKFIVKVITKVRASLY